MMHVLRCTRMRVRVCKGMPMCERKCELGEHEGGGQSR